ANGRVYTPDIPPSNFFLTGATGFVGAYLLQGLLERGAEKVYCHVRAADTEAGLARLKHNLEFYALWDDTYAGRIVAVPGDLALPNLGIAQAALDELAADVNVIYHNGAIVNFAYPYPALKAANVNGTREVLRLASREHVKPVHFISSISILFDGDLEAGEAFLEDVDLQSLNVPFGGYGQSKWIAEMMMFEAQRRGIPITIFRPDNVSGDTESGIWNADNMAHTLLKASLELGAVPDVEIVMGVVPVNFVSDAILHISAQPESFGKAYNLTSVNQISFSVLLEMFTALGYEIDRLSFAAWKDKIYQLALDNPEAGYHAFYQLIEHIGAGSLEQVRMPRMDLTNTLKGIEGTGIGEPQLDLELITKYIQYMNPDTE
ncbi:MAG: thioester reductase domain-containing protein, partial [Anaerolineales bacterium]|nr:thioester reductase domain-containing protein [Anaerolineales bacterium]